jgi:exodeoxyribonuclease V beta subunit
MNSTDAPNTSDILNNSDEKLVASSTESQILDPVTLALNDTALIEASAGTGKTYTLAALYLRLLLGLGREEPLDVTHILVVTFTEAATQELRERIRARIQEARIAFVLGFSDDPFIQQLLARHDDHARAVLDLEFAASEMDQAAIFTIHGFCQRMLSEHAFESGANFNDELVSDDSEIVRQALLDYWRVELYEAPDDLAYQILSHYAGPDQLFSKVRPYLGLAHIQLEPDFTDFDLAEKWKAFSESQQQLREELSAIINSDQECDDLLQIIQSSSVNKTSYSKKHLPNWYAKLCAFADGDEPDFKVLGRFDQDELIQKSKTDDVPRHLIFEKIGLFCAQKIDFKAVLFCRALACIRRNMQHQKAQYQQLSFDDLLAKLAAALQSSSGEMLAQVIRNQYPFALIDEFQDTDAQQYAIFSTLYQKTELATQDQNLGLLMIGDPKQAIYAFRGADIFTYIAARRQVTKHYTLDTNWRSSAAMVNATNQLFSRSSSAFIYHNDIPFQVMKAAKKQSPSLSLAGKLIPAMNFWVVSKALNNDQYLDHFANVCASQIETMLQHGQLKEQPVSAQNIAILVRDRKEASVLQLALSARSIDSVFMSNRDNVYSIYLAQSLIYLLKAVNEPTNEQSLRSAMASDIFRFTARELHNLNQDEMAWESLVEEFLTYRKIWQRSGVLAMMQQLLQKRALAARWLNDINGERQLTDYLHLAELLQQASANLESSEALIRFLQERCQEPSAQASEQQLRLDSDRKRVTIITIHKSKGLEYDLVYLPFICRYRSPTQGIYHDESGQPFLELVGDESKEKWQKEQLAEDLRLLYVAITRAAHGCFLGMAQVSLRNKSVWQKTAIGYLLNSAEIKGNSEEAQSDELMQVLEPLSDSCSDIGVNDVQSTSLTQGDMFNSLFDNPLETTAPDVLVAKQFTRKIQRDWRVTSYSALVKGGQHTNAIENLKLDLEVMQEDDSALPEPTEESQAMSIFNFAKGAVAGTFLHSIYEEIDFSETDSTHLEQVLQQKLMLSGYDEQWLPCLKDFVLQSLQVNLVPNDDQQSFCLQQIQIHDRLVEMEFVLVLNRIQSRAINQLLRTYDELAMRAGELAFEQVSGMLKGFIDLTLRYQGMYYVVDYKSNFLGDTIEDYNQQAMQAAMIDHRYDFQYVIYTLALHRLLKIRIADYSYDRDIGGVFYLFLRGLDATFEVTLEAAQRDNNDSKQANGVFYTKPDKALIEALDKLFEEGV